MSKKWNPIVEIPKMDIKELLEYIVDNPELLSDSYYRDIGNAIRQRAKELLK